MTRQTRQRQARGAVLTALIGIVSLHLGMGFFAETLRPDLYDPEYGHRLRQVRKMPRDMPLVVALGSSRVQMGLRPKELGVSDVRVYNFGIAGCGPVGQMLMMNRLFAAGVVPDAFVLELLPPVLNMEGPIEGFVKLPRIDSRDLPLLMERSEAPGTLVRGWLGQRLNAWYSTRLALVSRTCPGFLPWRDRLDYMWADVDETGWLPFPYDVILDEKRADYIDSALSQYKHHFANFHISPRPRDAIETMLQWCKERNIPVVMITMPEGSAFRNAYPADAWPQIDAFLAEMRDKHGLRVVHCRDWVPDLEFSDSHHLLKVGAKRFSERFGREVIPLVRDTIMSPVISTSAD